MGCRPLPTFECEGILKLNVISFFFSLQLSLPCSYHSLLFLPFFSSSFPFSFPFFSIRGCAEIADLGAVGVQFYLVFSLPFPSSFGLARRNHFPKFKAHCQSATGNRAKKEGKAISSWKKDQKARQAFGIGFEDWACGLAVGKGKTNKKAKPNAKPIQMKQPDVLSQKQPRENCDDTWRVEAKEFLLINWLTLIVCMILLIIRLSNDRFWRDVSQTSL